MGENAGEYSEKASLERTGYGGKKGGERVGGVRDGGKGIVACHDNGTIDESMLRGGGVGTLARLHRVLLRSTEKLLAAG